MADTNYDVIIIGSGPGGYVTAIRSAQLGFKTAIVEREHLGGICLNWGCIPTKALLRSAEIFDHANHAKSFGLTLEGAMKADVKDVVARSRGVSARLNGGVGFLMKKNKIDVIWGEAKLTKPGDIVVGKPSKLNRDLRYVWQGVNPGRLFDQCRMNRQSSGECKQRIGCA